MPCLSFCRCFTCRFNEPYTNFEGIPQQIVLTFDNSNIGENAMRDIFNLGDASTSPLPIVASVKINSGSPPDQYYVDTLSIELGLFGNTVVLNTFANPKNLVKDNETLIFTFLTGLDLSKITSSTLKQVTYKGNNIDINII